MLRKALRTSLSESVRGRNNRKGEENNVRVTSGIRLIGTDLNYR